MMLWSINREDCCPFSFNLQHGDDVLHLPKHIVLQNWDGDTAWQRRRCRYGQGSNKALPDHALPSAGQQSPSPAPSSHVRDIASLHLGKGRTAAPCCTCASTDPPVRMCKTRASYTNLTFCTQGLAAQSHSFAALNFLVSLWTTYMCDANKFKLFI